LPDHRPAHRISDRPQPVTVPGSGPRLGYLGGPAVEAFSWIGEAEFGVSGCLVVQSYGDDVWEGVAVVVLWFFRGVLVMKTYRSSEFECLHAGEIAEGGLPVECDQSAAGGASGGGDDQVHRAARQSDFPGVDQ
jgi:hypothetical protein